MDAEKRPYFGFVLDYGRSMPKKIILPERHHLLFIPQRPYLPLGSLRFQALFLLENRSDINERDLHQLFQSVNLQYLLERHTLDAVSNIVNSSYINREKYLFKVVDWPIVLSMGEQQRLSFLRLLALFTSRAKQRSINTEDFDLSR